MPTMICQKMKKNIFSQNSILKCSSIYFLKILCHFSDFLKIERLIRINENLNNVCYKQTFYRKYCGDLYNLNFFDNITHVDLVVTVFYLVYDIGYHRFH